MRFRIQTDILKKAIEATSHATSTSNLTPILENILIDAGYKRLVLTGNNLDMAIEYSITEGVDIEAEGRFTLSSRFLSSYISLVQDTEITLSLDKNGSIVLETSSGSTKIKGIDAEKFPTIPVIPSVTPIKIDARELRTAIDKTLFSTADGNVRPMLAGIYMRSEWDELIFASTDSFRLSDFHIKPKHAVEHVPIIIPARTAMELARLITDDIEDIEIYTHESQMLVQIWPSRLTSRLLSGKFPDYSGFFPKEFQTKTTVLRNDLINALKQVNLVARQNNYNTRIRSLHDGHIDIFTGDTEIGASTRTVSATVEWQEDTIGINSEYLLAALTVIKEDYVSFEYKNPLSPLVLSWVAGDKKETQMYRHLIMPLKI